MTSFSFAVASTSLVVLGSLLVYTIALMRTGRLSALIAVRWIIAETAAIAAVLVWGRLPVIAFTSSLGDRELLVILAVMFFGFVAFLMLDSLQRISEHSGELRRLTQEVALMRQRLDAAAGADAETAVLANAALTPTPYRTTFGPLAITVMVMWIVGCVVVYVLEGADMLPAQVTQLLTAAFKQ